MRKVNVAVVCSYAPDGFLCPKKVEWADGRVWEIERVLHTCRSPDMSFEGIRYTVLIEGKEKYLYQSGRHWYVFAS